jgi:hypothetical protein
MLLADEPGLGKTAQALMAASAHPGPHVVVCPASLVENWTIEWQKLGRKGPAPLAISYDRAARGFDLPKQIGTLTCDESHYLKNRTAKRTNAILFAPGNLFDRAERVFFLSGTPMPNHPGELWTTCIKLAPKEFEKDGKVLNYWQFESRYCRVRETPFGRQITGGKNLDDLKERMAKFTLRRTKAEVLEQLPPIRFDTLPVQAKMPKDVPAELRKWAAEDGTVEGLKKLSAHVGTVRRLTGMAKAEAVVDWAREWFDGGGGKLVLFAYHRDVLAGLAHGLADLGVALIAGETTDRQSQVDRFQNDENCRVFIGQIQAAGTGITLTASSNLVFCESSWIPAEDEQAAMRIHRIGQRDACLVRYATIPGSLDEQIQKAVMRKAATIAEVFA